MMSVTAVPDFYQSAHMVCRIGPEHFPLREGDPGATAGVEANEEVALSRRRNVRAIPFHTHRIRGAAVPAGVGPPNFQEVAFCAQ